MLRYQILHLKMAMNIIVKGMIDSRTSRSNMERFREHANNMNPATR